MQTLTLRSLAARHKITMKRPELMDIDDVQLARNKTTVDRNHELLEQNIERNASDGTEIVQEIEKPKPRNKRVKQLVAIKNTTKRRKTYSYAQVEGALQNVRNGISVKRAAKTWNIPRMTLAGWTKRSGIRKRELGPMTPVTIKAEYNNVLVEVDSEQMTQFSETIVQNHEQSEQNEVRHAHNGRENTLGNKQGYKKAKQKKKGAKLTHANKTLKRRRKAYTREQAYNALQDVKNGISAREAARRWNIPRTTLVDWKQGRYKIEARAGPSPVLTINEENSLCEWLLELHRRNIPINKYILIDSAQNIISRTGRKNLFANNRPGIGWFHAFMKRHPELSKRFEETVNQPRSLLSLDYISSWFNNAQEFFTCRNLGYILNDPKRQYNCFEYEFQLDRHDQSLAPKSKYIYKKAGSNKKQITIVITTCADGKLMRSTIVYPYKKFIPQYVMDKIPRSFVAARSELGCMTSDTFFNYMTNVFIPELALLRREEKGLTETEQLVLDDSDWVILWVDGYSSCLSIHTSEVCEMNKVLLYNYKMHNSYLSHFSEPFQPLELEWKNAFEEFKVTHPNKTLTQVEFASVLESACKKLDAPIITSWYKAIGLCPFSPTSVRYDQVINGENKTHQPCSHSSNVNVNECSITLRCIENFLGPDIVNKYNSLITKPVICSDDLPPINAFLVWRYFKSFLMNKVEALSTASGLTGCPIDANFVAAADFVADAEFVANAVVVDSNDYITLIKSEEAL